MALYLSLKIFPNSQSFSTLSSLLRGLNNITNDAINNTRNNPINRTDSNENTLNTNETNNDTTNNTSLRDVYNTLINNSSSLPNLRIDNFDKAVFNMEIGGCFKIFKIIGFTFNFYHFVGYFSGFI